MTGIKEIRPIKWRRTTTLQKHHSSRVQGEYRILFPPTLSLPDRFIKAIGSPIVCLGDRHQRPYTRAPEWHSKRMFSSKEMTLRHHTHTAHNGVFWVLSCLHYPFLGRRCASLSLSLFHCFCTFFSFFICLSLFALPFSFVFNLPLFLSFLFCLHSFSLPVAFSQCLFPFVSGFICISAYISIYRFFCV